MIDRIIEISETEAFLKARNRLLVVTGQDGNNITIPFSEIGVLLLSNPAISLTLPVLSNLLSSGGMAVITDRRFLPAGMVIPLASHFIQTERLALQSNVSLPVKKRCWQQIIKAKVNYQAALLNLLHGSDKGLIQMAGKVKSGDPENVESQAAQRYWKHIFNDPSFRRRRGAEDQNRLLNYGYTVLRAAAARAVCSVGLHPSISLHHHNRYDQFCLASDLMEPFRPLVDHATFEIVKSKGAESPLDKETKAALAGTMHNKVLLAGEMISAFQALTSLSSSLVEVFSNKGGRLTLPDSLFSKRKPKRKGSSPIRKSKSKTGF